MYCPYPQRPEVVTPAQVRRGALGTSCVTPVTMEYQTRVADPYYQLQETLDGQLSMVIMPNCQGVRCPEVMNCVSPLPLIQQVPIGLCPAKAQCGPSPGWYNRNVWTTGPGRF